MTYRNHPMSNQKRRQRTVAEQLAEEASVAAYEQKRLDDFTSHLMGAMKSKTDKQLRTAAALVNDESSHLRSAAYAAINELKRRYP